MFQLLLVKMSISSQKLSFGLINKTRLFSYIFFSMIKVYTDINNHSKNLLQSDIENLQNWASIWQLEFNIDKCVILHLGNNPNHTYTMTNNDKEVILKSSTEEKDLGVYVDNKLNFKMHINDTTSKANKILGIINRNFRYLPVNSYVSLYKTVVRSKLEYANVVWSPLYEARKL